MMGEKKKLASCRGKEENIVSSVVEVVKHARLAGRGAATGKGR